MKTLKIALFLGLLTFASCDSNNCKTHESCWQIITDEVVEFINGTINYQIDPCNDFWQFACGSWQPLPGQHHQTDNFGIIMESYIRNMREDFLESKAMELQPELQNVRNLVMKVQTFYQSCKDNNSNYLDIKQYLGEISKRIHWPNWSEAIKSDKSLDSDITWLEQLAELRRFGLNGIVIEERATEAFNDSTKYVIELRMPREDKSFEKHLQLTNYMVEFGLIDRVTDEVLTLTAQVFELDKQIKELQERHKKDKNASFEESLTLKKLQEKIPNIDWLKYFQVLLEVPEISLSLPIEVNGIGYFQDVSSLLSQRNSKVVAFNILLHLCQYILEIWPNESSDSCVYQTDLLMPLGVSYLYDRAFYVTRREDEAAFGNIFSKIKHQFDQYLEKNPMDLNEEEKEYLQQKSNKMTLRLGNLPSNVNTNFYDFYYDSANILPNNFYHNHWELLYFRTRQQHEGFLQNRSHIDLNAFYVNDDITQIRNAPYFVHERNVLIVPMTFLQLPFFHYTLNPLLQQSLAGFILGHEFNHAFDVDGILLDSQGNENSIGLRIRNKGKFISNLKCFEQTPTASLAERMADVNGFQLAYDAYFGDKTPIEVVELVCGFDKKKLFFLNFAQFFCGVLPEAIDHDRDDVRVNEIVRNIPEFAEVFECNKKNGNSLELCEMWRQ